MNIEKDLRNEIKKAESKYREYNSSYEGYAIIIEEVNELWEEVRKKDDQINEIKMYNEALHIACTAIRFCKMIKKTYKGILPHE